MLTRAPAYAGARVPCSTELWVSRMPAGLKAARNRGRTLLATRSLSVAGSALSPAKRIWYSALVRGTSLTWPRPFWSVVTVPTKARPVCPCVREKRSSRAPCTGVPSGALRAPIRPSGTP